MRIISFIEDDATIKKVLNHCGKWKETNSCHPSQIRAETATVAVRSYIRLRFLQARPNRESVFQIPLQKPPGAFCLNRLIVSVLSFQYGLFKKRLLIDVKPSGALRGIQPPGISIAIFIGVPFLYILDYFIVKNFI
jgi:hypothetical protein